MADGFLKHFSKNLYKIILISILVNAVVVVVLWVWVDC